MWLLSTRDAASLTKEQNFKFDLILITLYSPLWLMANILEKSTLDSYQGLSLG